jgi:hypothetical protein
LIASNSLQKYFSKPELASEKSATIPGLPQ